MGSSRTPAEDVEIAGVTLPAGRAVSVSLPAANRDPGAFTDPDRFDITRFTASGTRPSAIASFGHGVHFCLGAALARAEGRIGLERALTRLGDMRLTAPLRWVPYAHIRRYERAPVAFDR
ncbi:MAG: cytochrome P450 [Acidimicrobiia bacterium]